MDTEEAIKTLANDARRIDQEYGEKYDGSDGTRPWGPPDTRKIFYYEPGENGVTITVELSDE